METILATLAAAVPEAATTAAAEAAATAAAEAAAAEAAAGVTTMGLGELGTGITSAIPEAVTAAVPETAVAAVPEVATAVVPESSGILQANNALLDTSMGPNMAATNVAPPPTGSIGPDFGQLGPTGVDTTVPSPEAANIGPNYNTPGGYSETAANTADKGIGSYFDQGWKSASDLFSNAGDKFDKASGWIEAHPKTSLGLGLMGAKVVDAMTRQKIPGPEKYNGPLSKYHLASNYEPAIATPTYYTPKYAAAGGIMSLAMGGPATMAQPNQMYPQSQQDHTQFATPTQQPTSAEVIGSGYEPVTNPYTGVPSLRMASGGETSNPLLEFYKQNINPKLKEAPTADVGIHEDIDADTRLQDPLTAATTRAKKLDFMTKAIPFKAQQIHPQLAQAQQQAMQAASGGIVGYSLGGYAAGGRQPRLLKGPGDGMSDNIPATIADRQPARLADGEFVVPADVVSHLGNGSTDAGAQKLHGMMDKVRVARTGKKSQGTQINPNKYMPK